MSRGLGDDDDDQALFFSFSNCTVAADCVERVYAPFFLYFELCSEEKKTVHHARNVSIRRKENMPCHTRCCQRTPNASTLV